MARQISEQQVFDKASLEGLAKRISKLNIIGQMFQGDFQGQTAEWRPDGSLVIVTTYTRDRE